jgi:hypothetical protein
MPKATTIATVFLRVESAIGLYVMPSPKIRYAIIAPVLTISYTNTTSNILIVGPVHVLTPDLHFAAGNII